MRTGWGGLTVVAFAVAVLVVPPAVMLLLELGAGRLYPRARRLLHIGFVGVLAAVFAAYLGKKEFPTQAEWFLLTPLVGAAAAAAYVRFVAVRLFLTALAPATLLAAGLFLFDSPVKHLVLAKAPSPVAGKPRTAPPIVFIVLDELPASSLMTPRGNLDGQAYPGFGELAADSTWYRRATSPADNTHTAMPSVLSGRLAGGLPPSAHSYPDTLFALLRQSYQIRAREPLDLCPAEVCGDPTLGAGDLLSRSAQIAFTQHLPEFLLLRAEALRFRVVEGSPNAPQEFRNFVAELGAARRATLDFLHVVLPHQQWIYLPSGTRYEINDCCLKNLVAVFDWKLPQHQIDSHLQRHLAQLRYTDRLLGGVIDRLKRLGLYDEALVVVTADHGISFQGGIPPRTLTPQNADDLLGVPLFIKPPRQRTGRIVDSRISTIDIVPTIADVLDLPIPWKTDGRSLLANARDATAVRAVAYGERKPRRLPGPVLDRGRRATLLRRGSLFGTGATGTIDLFAFGPHRDLLGRRVSESARVTAAAGVFRLDRPGAYASVSPDDKRKPALVTARVRGPAIREGQTLAIVLNGRAAATAQVYRTADGLRVAALVPEQALRPGRNVVEAFVVGGSGRALRLSRLNAAERP